MTWIRYPTRRLDLQKAFNARGGRWGLPRLFTIEGANHMTEHGPREQILTLPTSVAREAYKRLAISYTPERLTAI